MAANDKPEDEAALRQQARELLHQLRSASLGTLAERDHQLYPFVSLVQPGLSTGGEPILLLSDLSDHAKNLKANAHASLMFDGTQGLKEPLTGPRLSLIGEVHPSIDEADRKTYLAQHPAAEFYAGFGDFRFYRFRIIEALFVAGFGRIRRLTPADLRQR